MNYVHFHWDGDSHFEPRCMACIPMSKDVESLFSSALLNKIKNEMKTNFKVLVPKYEYIDLLRNFEKFSKKHSYDKVSKLWDDKRFSFLMFRNKLECDIKTMKEALYYFDRISIWVKCYKPTSDQSEFSKLNDKIVGEYFSYV